MKKKPNTGTGKAIPVPRPFGQKSCSTSAPLARKRGVTSEKGR